MPTLRVINHLSEEELKHTAPVLSLAVELQYDVEVVFLYRRCYEKALASRYGKALQQKGVRFRGDSVWECKGVWKRLCKLGWLLMAVVYDLPKAVLRKNKKRWLEGIVSYVREVSLNRPEIPDKYRYCPPVTAIRRDRGCATKSDMVLIDMVAAKHLLGHNPGLAKLIASWDPAHVLIGFHSVGMVTTRANQRRLNMSKSILTKVERISQLVVRCPEMVKLEGLADVRVIEVGVLSLASEWRKYVGDNFPLGINLSRSEKNAVGVLLKGNLSLGEDYYRRIVKRLFDAVEESGLPLVIKLHYCDVLEEVRKIAPPGAQFAASLDELFARCGRLVSCPSTVLYDVAASGIPAVAWYPDYDTIDARYSQRAGNWQIICRESTVPVVESDRELKEFLGKDLEALNGSGKLETFGADRGYRKIRELLEEERGHIDRRIARR